MANELINNGAKALVVATAQPAALTAVVAAARAHHVPTVDYDTHGAASAADYSLAIDHRAVGELQGRGVIRGMRSTPDASIVELEDAPDQADTDAMVAGQADVLQPRFDKGVYRLAGSQRFTGADEARAGTTLDKQLAATGNKISAVVAADDLITAEVLDVLSRHQLAGKVVVAGTGIAPDTLKAIRQPGPCTTTLSLVT